MWVQVIRELRNGVKLKKVDYNRTPIEFELTPYEILMDDIRSRRYKLNKVMVDGDIPHKVKKDAHAIILEFIRSRPPLRKASDRKLRPAVSRPSTPREMLMDSIKQGRTLRPSLSPLKKKGKSFGSAEEPDKVQLNLTSYVSLVCFVIKKSTEVGPIGKYFVQQLHSVIITCILCSCFAQNIPPCFESILSLRQS